MTARIADRGYSKYEGERGGRNHAVRVLFIHGVTRALGVRRPLWAKIVVIATAALSFLPAIVFVGLVALLPDDQLRDLILPTYGEYYGFVTAAIVLFTAFVAPELLCTDRRSGMLGLYLASPLDRVSYLVARGGSIGAVLAVATIGPPALLLVAYSLQGAGPEGIGGFIEIALRVLGAGLAVTIFMTALSMAVASFTERNAYASAGIILGLLVSAAVANILVEAVDAPAAVGLLNLFAVPFEISTRIYAETSGGGLADLNTALVIGAGVAWVALFVAAIHNRYVRAEVTR